MTSREDIKYAIEQSLMVIPDLIKTLSNVLCMCSKEFNPRYFTRTNGAREKISGATCDDIIFYLMDTVIRVYKAGNIFINKNSNTEEARADFIYEVPLFLECERLVEKWSNINTNAFVSVKSNYDDILTMSQLVASIFKDKNLYEFIELNGHGPITTVSGFEFDLASKVKHDKDVVTGMSDVIINRKAVNKCKIDVLNGAQIKYKHNSYSYGNMFASQDIGKYKDTQEDTMFILEHPKFPSIKFVAVADGVGGSAYGEVASTFITSELTKWFDKLSEDKLADVEWLQRDLNNQILILDKALYSKFKCSAGSTFTGALITPNGTIISSVGDSRAYTLDDYFINLETRDESPIWNKYAKKTPTPQQLADDRFAIGNNQIYRMVGCGELGYIQSKIIPNTYDKLFIVSDGITDVITQESIQSIAYINSNEAITELIVKQALTNYAIRPQGEDLEHRSRVEAGKDNASVVMYSRR